MSVPPRQPAEKKPVRRLPRGERKRQLLAQARQLLATQGYAATTLEQLAAHVGVSLAVFRRYFPTKKDVVEEWLRELAQDFVPARATASAADADPLAQLHVLAERWLALGREKLDQLRLLHRLLLEHASEADLLTPVRELYLQLEGQLAQLIAAGQQSGVFRHGLDPRVAAGQLLCTALGYVLTSTLDIPTYQEPDYPAHALECLLHGLLKTDI